MGSWVDLILFGHQITIHQVKDDRIVHPIDHFGPILSDDEWFQLKDKLKKEKIKFILDPLIKNKGEKDENGKFLIEDPAGNILEFKYYKRYKKTVLKK